jgi:hypothetical protein
MNKDNRNRPGSQENTDRVGTDAGEYKNIQTAVNNPAYFDEDYAVGEEERIAQNEVDTEDENNVHKGSRGNA